MFVSVTRAFFRSNHQWQEMKEKCGCIWYFHSLQYKLTKEERGRLCTSVADLKCAATTSLEHDDVNEKECPPMWRTHEYVTRRTEFIYPVIDMPEDGASVRTENRPMTRVSDNA